MSARQADAAPGDAGAQPATRPVRERRGQRRRRELPGWLMIAVPVLAELLVGGYRIAGPSLWRDEGYTIVGSQRPAGAIWALVQNEDAVHGPYYLLMHFVIAAGGTSETVLRLPSLIAMCLAAGLTAAVARRLAVGTGLAAPSATGLAAGLLLTAVPLTTRYAQEARTYGLTVLLAVLATYLLIRAALSGRRAWWGGYALALALLGMFSMLAVLLAVAHGVSLAAARLRGARLASPALGAGVRQAGDAAQASDAGGAQAGMVAEGAAACWLAACAAAAIALTPMIILSVAQSSQVAWITRPDLSAVASLVRDFAGGILLIPVIGLLAALGCVAGHGLRRGNGLTVAVVTLPWLVLPPVLLLAVSLVRPVYVERYVVFCLPALSVLSAAGLTWLAELTAAALRGRRGIAGRRPAEALAVVPSVLLAVLVVTLLIGPQRAVRLATARVDNLRAVAATVAANERPGDAIAYLPWDTRAVGMAYPGPFRGLRNIELGASPVASATLRGTEAPGSVVTARLRGVRRLWTVQWAQQASPGGQAPAAAAAAAAIRGMRLIKRWHIASVLLSLYAAA